jgi:carboxyl-terminal processing protease
MSFNKRNITLIRNLLCSKRFVITQFNLSLLSWVLLPCFSSNLSAQQTSPQQVPQLAVEVTDDVKVIAEESAGDEEIYDLLKLFVDTLDQIDRNYVQEVNRRELVDAAIEGMLKKLDRHSNYIPPSNIDRFKQAIENVFGGIGIQTVLNRGNIEIVTPISGSPAYTAGIRPGDLIRKINDESTAGMQLSDVAARLKGKIGTSVNLTIESPKYNETKQLTVERQLIEIESVYGAARNNDDSWNLMIDEENSIGYLLITNFGRNTSKELLEALKQLKEKDVQGLIIDLRYNPGGLLTAAIEICDMFIPAGRIVSTEGRSVPKRVWDAKAEGTFEGFPIAILINQFSASASEIVSACLQDHDRAVVVGQRSYGKGSVQNIIQLEGGRSALKLTTAGYLRPSGKNIDRPHAQNDADWGVKPNDNLTAEFTVEQNRLLRLWRRDLNIVRNGATHDPFVDKEYRGFHDAQLHIAKNYLYEALDLPPTEAPPQPPLAGTLKEEDNPERGTKRGNRRGPMRNRELSNEGAAK